MVRLPPGIRNNDPGNIRKSPTRWQGELPETDSSFEIFASPLYGLRAMMILLLNYYRKRGLDTVHAIVNRWAPPSENDTASYASAVATALGVAVRQKIDPTDPRILIALTMAMVRQENGKPPPSYPENWYDAAIYEEACRMACQH